jgi:hypothetical protein
MAECKILKPFPFSEDGFTSKQAVAGETRSDVPVALQPGLEREGYIVRLDPETAATERLKAQGAAPENKMLGGAAQNKAEVREHYVLGSGKPITMRGAPVYEARDVGRGWFAVFRGDAEVEAMKKMRRDDADTFNALSPAERAAYVEAESED